MRAALIVRKIAGAGKLHGRCRVSYACGVIYDKRTVTLVRATVMYAQALAWQFPRQAFARAPPA